VSGLYEKLDELRKLSGSESMEEILDGMIDRQKRLDHMAELQSHVMLTAHEMREFQVLKQPFRPRSEPTQKRSRRADDAFGGIISWGDGDSREDLDVLLGYLQNTRRSTTTPRQI
jgi:hypothetical protein